MELEETDRLLHVFAAIDALAESEHNRSPAETERGWNRGSQRLGIWTNLSKGGHYTQDELSEARRVAKDLRDIAAHGSDAVLVNLGYPASAVRTMMGGRPVAGERLGLGMVAGDLPIILTAAVQATRTLFREAVRRGWDDAWYESRFA